MIIIQLGYGKKKKVEKKLDKKISSKSCIQA